VANGQDNLIPQAHVLTVEDQSAGGIASGEVRRRKASFKQAIKWLAESDIRITEGKLYDMYMENGIDISKLSPTELATIGLWFGAATGKNENYRTLMEGNKEITEAGTTPEISINIIDNTNLEKALYKEDKE
jgi:hypothetical protein